MNYRLVDGAWPQRDDGVSVNPDSNREYLAWLDEGNRPAPVAALAPEVLAKVAAQGAAKEAVGVDPFLQKLATLAPQAIYDEVLKGDDQKVRQIIASLAMAEALRVKQS